MYSSLNSLAGAKHDETTCSHVSTFYILQAAPDQGSNPPHEPLCKKWKTGVGVCRGRRMLCKRNSPANASICAGQHTHQDRQVSSSFGLRWESIASFVGPVGSVHPRVLLYEGWIISSLKRLSSKLRYCFIVCVSFPRKIRFLCTFSTVRIMAEYVMRRVEGLECQVLFRSWGRGQNWHHFSYSLLLLLPLPQETMRQKPTRGVPRLWQD